MTSVAPFLIFFVGAALAAVARGRPRAAVMLAIPILGALNLWALNHWAPAEGVHAQVALFDYTLTLVRVDRLSLLFGYLFHLAAFIAIVYSLHVRDTVQHTAGLLYAGSALCAVFAGDLISLFVFWELTAISSVLLIWSPCDIQTVVRSGIAPNRSAGGTMVSEPRNTTSTVAAVASHKAIVMISGTSEVRVSSGFSPAPFTCIR